MLVSLRCATPAGAVALQCTVGARRFVLIALMMLLIEWLCGLERLLHGPWRPAVGERRD